MVYHSNVKYCIIYPIFRRNNWNGNNNAFQELQQFSNNCINRNNNYCNFINWYRMVSVMISWIGISFWYISSSGICFDFSLSRNLIHCSWFGWRNCMSNPIVTFHFTTLWDIHFRIILICSLWSIFNGNLISHILQPHWLLKLAIAF